MISGLDWISSLEIFGNNFSFSEYNILWIITIIGLSSYYFAMKIDEGDDEKPIKKSGSFSLHKNYDWKIIFRALSPLVLISVGAGLTIPFVNLFFNSVLTLVQAILVC